MKRSHPFLSRIAFCTIVLFCVSAPVESASPKVFRLSDGTTLKGTVTGIRSSDDAYLIETDTMGTVAVHPDHIVQMTSAGHVHAPAQEPGASLPNTLQNAQQLLLTDPAIQSALQELTNDPEMRQLLEDPAVLQTMMSMDPNAIQSNPKIQKLLQSPAMQKILELSGEKLMGMPY